MIADVGDNALAIEKGYTEGGVKKREV